MNYEKYDVEALDGFLQFEFYSEGPKGRIAKRIQYKKVEDKPDVYNLSFGDVDKGNRINDLAVSDNKDTLKVLATVAQTLTQFFEAHPDKWIFVSGSTPARTRLYRMLIGRNLDEFAKQLDLLGLVERNWEPFKKNGAYIAFIARKL